MRVKRRDGSLFQIRSWRGIGQAVFARSGRGCAERGDSLLCVIKGGQEVVLVSLWLLQKLF